MSSSEPQLAGDAPEAAHAEGGTKDRGMESKEWKQDI